jgi:hypothetical protein
VQNGHDFLETYLFPDNQPYCERWLSDYKKTNILMGMIILTMSVINIVTELIIGFASEMSRPQNYTKILKDTIAGITWI